MQRPARTARDVVVDALAAQVAVRPVRRRVPAVEELSARDRQLALAIHRTVLDHLLSLEYLLKGFLHKPVWRLEPGLAAILLAGAAQVLFMPHIPAHAAVSQAVEQARRRVRAGAGALVNAVLRQITQLAGPIVTDRPWQPGKDRLPLDAGWVQLKRQVLPDPAQAVHYWSVASSHPPALVEAWFEQFGCDLAQRLLLHSMKRPPVFLHGPQGMRLWENEQPSLEQYLAEHPQWWVQDPTAARPVQATAGLEVRLVIDYCAGRGTKTRQLAALHPRARIVATDVHPRRYQALERLAGGNVEVLPYPQVLTMTGQADLLVLDVPCTNTGVLARRPEARYRYSGKTVGKLCDLQRSIFNQALPLVRPGGWVLYATCSIEDAENLPQAERLAGKMGGKIVRQETTLPDGRGAEYHDGGYWALVGC